MILRYFMTKFDTFYLEVLQIISAIITYITMKYLKRKGRRIKNKKLITLQESLPPPLPWYLRDK